MPFNGAGLYAPPAADFPAVANTLIQSALFNDLINDMSTALSLAITKDGQQTVTANIPFANFALTGVGSGLAARTRAANIGDVQDGTTQWMAAGGTADALTATYAPAITALIDGQICCVRAASANATSTPTFAPNGLTAHTITKLGGSAVLVGEWGALQELTLRYNLANTRWELVGLPRSDSFRLPLNINPNWLLDQIKEGGVYTQAGGSADTQGPDGWTSTATGAGSFTMQVAADPDNAARNCLKLSCTVADAAIAAADQYRIYTAVEGFDLRELSPGTASASQVTLQFQFKTNVTGVYGVAFWNGGVNRRYIGIITVSDTSVHDYSITLTLDTGGTWLYTTGVGMYMVLTLAAGSNFQSTAGAWAGSAESTTSAQCNFMSANTNVAYLGRVHLLPGSVALPYAPSDIERELAKAQRYYAKTFIQGLAVAQAVGLSGGKGELLTGDAYANNAGIFVNWDLPVEMRSTPTVVTYNPNSAASTFVRTDLGENPTATVLVISSNRVSIGCPAGGTTTQNNHYWIHATANARLN